MTKEELKQKAIEASDKKCVKGCSKYYRYGFQEGYIAGATEATKEVVVEHFEAYGQCRDSRRIVDLENKLANVSYQLEGREVELKELQKKVDQLQGYLDHDIEYDIEQKNIELQKENQRLTTLVAKYMQGEE